LRRVVWNLAADPGVLPPSEEAPEPRVEEDQAQQGQQGGGGGQGANAPGRGAGAGGGAGQAGAGGGGGGGRGGRGGGTAVQPGRFRAQIGKLVGETFTPLGPVQTFQVVTLPERSYQLYR
jgi:hypothetical protein